MMSKFIMGMMGGITLLMCLPVNSDVLGETDDTYTGFQMAIPHNGKTK
jgi:hypothetical protein